MRPACFFDRDGVLNHLVIHADTGLPDSPLCAAQMRATDGAAAAIRAVRERGYLVVVVTNQPAYAKGKASLEDLQAAQAELEAQLVGQGAPWDALYVCYHHPTESVVPELARECDCRKPRPGMLLRAAAELDIDLRQSWMVGDRNADMLAGRAVGCRTIHITGGQDAVAPDAEFACDSVCAAADIILREGPLR